MSWVFLSRLVLRLPSVQKPHFYRVVSFLELGERRAVPDSEASLSEDIFEGRLFPDALLLTPHCALPWVRNVVENSDARLWAVPFFSLTGPPDKVLFGTGQKGCELHVVHVA